MRGKEILLIILGLCIPLPCLLGQTGGERGADIDTLKAKLAHATHDTARALILYRLSRDYDYGDSKQGLAYADEGIVLSEKIDFKKGIVLNSNAAGFHAVVMQDLPTAYNYYKRGMKAALRQKDPALLRMANHGFGSYYSAKGDEENAILYTLKEIEYLESIGVSDANTYLNAVEGYKVLKQFEKVIPMFDRGLALAEKKGVIKSLLGLGLNKADFLIDQGKPEQAQQALDKVWYQLDTARNVIQWFRAYATYVQAHIYQQTGQFGKGLDGYHKALGIGLQAGYLSEAVNNCRQIAAIYHTLATDPTARLPGRPYGPGSRKGALQKEIEYLRKGLSFARQENDLQPQPELLEKLAQAYERAGQYDKALMITRDYEALKDTIDNLDKRTKALNEILSIQFQRRDDSIQFKQQLAEQNLKVVEKDKALKESQLNAEQQRRYYYLGGIVALVGFSGFAFQSYRRQKKSNVIISREKQRSEDLLLNILPEEVAEELKAKGSADARLFDEVTVLFTDFVGFTNVAEQLTPKELVAELHACFEAFDGIIGKYGLEKIKTIGDAYLAVAGLPVAIEDHAAKSIQAALDIRDFMAGRHAQMGDRTFQIRIGLHSGSVVAGIVGVKKFAYDIWGDAVNTAARMEQSGQAGRVNVSSATYDLIRDRFACEHRGQIAAKNKGHLEMYFVERAEG